jgi:membrane protease YdiL (CAAX protease family)
MSSVPPPSPSPPAPPPEAIDTPEPPQVALDQPPWRLWSAPAAIVVGLALGVVATIIVEVVATLGGSSLSHPTPAVSIIGDVAFDLSFVAAALYFAFLQGRPRASDFGFRRVSLRLAVKAFVVAAISYYLLTAVYAQLLSLHGSDKLPSELGVSKSTAALVAAAVFVCVIAPIAEEFFFRGFVFGVLRGWRITAFGRNIGTWVAAVLTGILFGLAHTGSASPQYLVPLGFLGFALCIVRWRTGSLYPGMALHSANNALALGVSQLSWNAPEILGLMLGSWLLIAVVTAPLGARSPALSVAPDAFPLTR